MNIVIYAEFSSEHVHLTTLSPCYGVGDDVKTNVAEDAIVFPGKSVMDSSASRGNTVVIRDLYHYKPLGIPTLRISPDYGDEVTMHGLVSGSPPPVHTHLYGETNHITSTVGASGIRGMQTNP